MTTSSTQAPPSPLTIDLPTHSLAALRWPAQPREADQANVTLVGLHGWLDNAESWRPIFTSDSLQGIERISLDLSGHGLSEHRPGHDYGYFLSWVQELHQCLRALDRPNVVLCGHSMGAGISTLYAGTFPDQLAGMLLVDGLTPFTNQPEQLPGQLARAIRLRLRPERDPRVYSDLDTLIERMRAARTPMAPDSLRAIAQRGSMPADEPPGVLLRHDPGLQAPSYFRLSDEHTQAFLENITCPALVLRAKQGLEVSPDYIERATSAAPQLQLVELDGHHHLHMDHPQRCLPYLLELLESLTLD